MSRTARDGFFSKTITHEQRSLSQRNTPSLIVPSPNQNSMTRYAQKSSATIDFNKTAVKPRILESKVSSQEDFMNLSEGFKRVFANDARD